VVTAEQSGTSRSGRTRTRTPVEAEPVAADSPSDPAYRLPMVGVRIPEVTVNRAFWVGLAGAAVLGAIDLPVAAVVGAGVVVARHRRRT
jgi:hypothetical protein